MKKDLSHKRFSKLCKALGHPARVSIIELLKAHDKCICGELVDLLPLAQSTVSQHLKALKNAGFIKGNIDGPRVCYCLNKKTFDRLNNYIEIFCRKTIDGRS